MTLEALIETVKTQSDTEAIKHLNESRGDMQTLVDAMQSSNVQDKLQLLKIPVLKTCAENLYIYQNLIEADKERFTDLRCAISYDFPEIPANTENYNDPASLLALWKHVEDNGKDLANIECSSKDIRVSYDTIEQIDKKVKNFDKKKTEPWTAKFNEQIDLLKKILNQEEFDPAKIDKDFLLFGSNVWMSAFLASNNEALVKGRFQSFNGLNDEQVFQILKIFDQGSCLSKIKQEDAQKACMVTLDKRDEFDLGSIDGSDTICSRIFNSIHEQHLSKIDAKELVEYVTEYNSTDNIINVLTKNHSSLVLNEEVLFDSLAYETQGFVDFIFDNFDKLVIADKPDFIEQLLESIERYELSIEDFKRYAPKINKRSFLSGMLVVGLCQKNLIEHTKIMIEDSKNANDILLSCVDFSQVDSDFLNLVAQYCEFSGDRVSLEKALKKVLLHIENKKEFVIIDQLFQANLSLDKLYVEVQGVADQSIGLGSETTKKTVVMLAYDLGHMLVVDWLIENKFKEINGNQYLTHEDRGKLEQRRVEILQGLEGRTSKLKNISFDKAKVGGQTNFFQSSPNKRNSSEQQGGNNGFESNKRQKK
jgi:hypothetical protein